MRQKNFLKLTAATFAIIGAGAFLFSAAAETAMAASAGTVETVPTSYQVSASQVSTAGQSEAEAKKEDRKETDYHVSMDRLNTGTPTELDLTMEEAAQKGAQYLESLYGLDLEGAYVYMMYSPGTVTFPRAFWAADVLFEEAQTPESTRWNYLIDAVTGELFSIDHSRHLDASPSLEPDSALEKDYSAYAALAEEKVRTSGLMDGG